MQLHSMHLATFVRLPYTRSVNIRHARSDVALGSKTKASLHSVSAAKLIPSPFVCGTRTRLRHYGILSLRSRGQLPDAWESVRWFASPSARPSACGIAVRLIGVKIR